MSNSRQNLPSIPAQVMFEHANRTARITLYGHPWDSIENIKAMASRILEHPPAHPEKKRADIIRRIEEIGRLADELIQDMPKSKSRRGAIGVE